MLAELRGLVGDMESGDLKVLGSSKLNSCLTLAILPSLSLKFPVCKVGFMTSIILYLKSTIVCGDITKPNVTKRSTELLFGGEEANLNERI